MKTKHFAVACCLLGAILKLQAQGYIVPNGVTDLGYLDGLGYTITVIQNPTNGDYTGFTLVPQGKTPPTLFTNTFSFSFFMDEGVRVFAVSSNDSISLQPILSQSYPELGAHLFLQTVFHSIWDFIPAIIRLALPTLMGMSRVITPAFTQTLFLAGENL